MRVPRARALSYVVLSLVLGIGAWAIGVGSLFGQRTEAMVLDTATFTYTPPAPLSLVTTPRAIAALFVIALLAWWVHGLTRALISVLAVGAAVVASQLLKQQVLVRPELFEFNADNTFPSGHMTLFVALSAALIWAVPRGIRSLVTLGTVIVCGTVALQLLQYGWHRPSDVVGGLALALLSFALCALVFANVSKRGSTPNAAVVRAGNRILSIIILLASVATLVVGLVMIAISGWIGASQLLLLGAQFSLVGATGLTLRGVQALTN